MTSKTPSRSTGLKPDSYLTWCCEQTPPAASGPAESVQRVRRVRAEAASWLRTEAVTSQSMQASVTLWP